MEKKFYNCYSPKMMMFFAENEILPIDMFFHDETNKRIWVYKLDDKLSNLLRKWTAMKNV
ncbi:hypothetical protein ABE073_04190 [Lederbergia citrisecunda]|uniref:hypothetical protein n=1 Tax=Lederbergia citrisecunda TaxID=2833583 RepID=UPI003D2B9FC3